MLPGMERPLASTIGGVVANHCDIKTARIETAMMAAMMSNLYGNVSARVSRRKIKPASANPKASQPYHGTAVASGSKITGTVDNATISPPTTLSMPQPTLPAARLAENRFAPAGESALIFEPDNVLMVISF